VDEEFDKGMKNKKKSSFILQTQSILFDIPIIIIADDNEIINMSNKKIFETIIRENNLNFRIFICSDGLDIIKLVLQHDKNYNSIIKCIFTDENMDYFCGSEAIRFVRKLEKVKIYQQCKIVSMTCYEDNKFIDNIEKAGADLVISKPITKNILLNTMKKIGLI